MTTSPQDCWQHLADHAIELQSKDLRMSSLFAEDPDRARRHSLQVAGIHLDYSRHLLTDKTLSLLTGLAEECQLEQAINALFSGDIVNPTEQQPALHVALRGHRVERMPECEQQVEAVLQRMDTLCQKLHEQQWQGFGGETIRDIVNIGIGGSDLGPAMVAEALQDWQKPGVHCHFVSNVDPAHLHRTLRDLDPGRTVFVIASKSFSTQETMENAVMARQWLLDNGATPSTINQHLIAVTARPEKAAAFGVIDEHIFPFWDWVGGRFSLWSAIGLPVALSIGMTEFRALLAGGRLMDQHFESAPLGANMPVILALLSLWYTRYWQAGSQVVLPYSQALERLPAHLQQLEMESLGKSTNLNGKAVDHATGAVLWGSAGTNGQHSFHQLLHQGTALIPADFIAIARCPEQLPLQQHRILLAHCFAQSQALMQGKSIAEAEAEMLEAGIEASQARLLAPHKATPGNRPSSTLLLDRLDPGQLGALIALYEHKVYALSVLLHINAFDQWGVELGKQLSGGLLDALQNGTTTDLDPASRNLVSRCRALQKGQKHQKDQQ